MKQDRTVYQGAKGLRQEDCLNRMLSSLKEKGAIDSQTYEELHLSSSRPGILYRLPKVHKPGVPLRPILSAIGTCGYKLAKFFIPHLTPLTKNEYTVNDTFSFVDEIQNLHPNASVVMASFDIKSLFPNIPLEKTAEIAANGLYNNGGAVLNLSKNQFKELLV